MVAAMVAVKVPMVAIVNMAPVLGTKSVPQRTIM